MNRTKKTATNAMAKTKSTIKRDSNVHFVCTIGLSLSLFRLCSASNHFPIFGFVGVWAWKLRYELMKLLEKVLKFSSNDFFRFVTLYVFCFVCVLGSVSIFTCARFVVWGVCERLLMISFRAQKSRAECNTSICSESWIFVY